MADIQCEGYRFLELKIKLRTLFIGECRLLPNTTTLQVAPVTFGYPFQFDAYRM